MTDNEKNANERENEQDTSDPDYGYKWFPDRAKDRGISERLWHGRGHAKCNRKVQDCIRKDPTVGLILNALKSYGCKLEKRHISCENCLEGRAAYDFRSRQIVFCQNRVKTSGYCSTLGHELIHAFDDCRAKVDYKNIDHIACTEIRAANIAQCDFFHGVMSGVVSKGLDHSQKECVRGHAMYSLMMSRNLSQEKALEAIDRVWDRCYNDLEPVGRRFKRNTIDRVIAHEEGKRFDFS